MNMDYRTSMMYIRATEIEPDGRKFRHYLPFDEAMQLVAINLLHSSKRDRQLVYADEYGIDPVDDYYICRHKPSRFPDYMIRCLKVIGYHDVVLEERTDPPEWEEWNERLGWVASSH